MTIDRVNATIWSVVVSLVLAASTLFLLSGLWRPEYVRVFDFDLQRVINILLMLLVVSLFVERAAEVILTVFFKPTTQKKKDEREAVLDRMKALAHQRSRLEDCLTTGKYDSYIAKLTGRPSADDVDRNAVLQALNNTKNDIASEWKNLADSEGKIAERRSAAIRLSAGLSFVLGIVISLIGIRSLTQLADPTALQDLVSDFQRRCFTAMDVLITGALIGGGTDSIHQIMMVITDTAEKLRRIAQEDKTEKPKE